MYRRASCEPLVSGPCFHATALERSFEAVEHTLEKQIAVFKAVFSKTELTTVLRTSVQCNDNL